MVRDVTDCPQGKRWIGVTCWRLILAAGMVFVLGAPAAVASDEWVSAIARRDLPAIERLLAQGNQDVNRAAKGGKTALMVAAGAGREELVSKLLAAGANVNSANARGGTALMYAATHGDPKTVGVLLSRGAKVNAKAQNGWTALTLAAAKGYEAVVRQLLDSGADANIADIYGWTPLLRAVDGDRVGVVRILLEDKSVQVNVGNEQGETALHLAAGVGAFEIARLLIAHGANVQAKDAAGRTPAMVAKAEGYASLAEFIERSEKK